MNKKTLNLTTKDVACMCKVSESTIKLWRRTRSNELPYRKYFGRVFYNKNNVLKFIKKNVKIKK